MPISALLGRSVAVHGSVWLTGVPPIKNLCKKRLERGYIRAHAHTPGQAVRPYGTRRPNSDWVLLGLCTGAQRIDVPTLLGPSPHQSLSSQSVCVIRAGTVGNLGTRRDTSEYAVTRALSRAKDPYCIMRRIQNIGIEVPI
jgi:hypothetical protein